MKGTASTPISLFNFSLNWAPIIPLIYSIALSTTALSQIVSVVCEYVGQFLAAIINRWNRFLSPSPMTDVEVTVWRFLFCLFCTFPPLDSLVLFLWISPQFGRSFAACALSNPRATSGSFGTATTPDVKVPLDCTNNILDCTRYDKSSKPCTTPIRSSFACLPHLARFTIRSYHPWMYVFARGTTRPLFKKIYSSLVFFVVPILVKGPRLLRSGKIDVDWDVYHSGDP